MIIIIKMVNNEINDIGVKENHFWNMGIYIIETENIQAKKNKILTGFGGDVTFQKLFLLLIE